MQYGISSKNVVHVIREPPNNWWYGFRISVCGKEFFPVKVVDSIPDNAKICRNCKKHLEVKEAH